MQFPNYQDSDTKIRRNDIADKWSMTDVTSPIETSVKKIKLVLTFEGEFEQDISRKTTAQQVFEYLQSQNFETVSK